MERYKSLYDLVRWINLIMDGTEFLGFGKYKLLLDIEDKQNMTFKACNNVKMRLMLVRDRKDLCVICSYDGAYKPCDSNDVFINMVDSMAAKILKSVNIYGIQ